MICFAHNICHFDRSGSSSSGSYQTMRNTMFAYTGRESCGPSLGVINEKSHQEHSNHVNDSSHQHPDPQAYRRQVAAPKAPTNHITRNFNTNENKNQPVPQASPHNVNPQIPQQYHTVDHQYHKGSNNYNGYAAQRSVAQGYQNSGQQMQQAAANTNGIYQHQQTAYQTTHANYQNSGYQSAQHAQMPYHSGYTQGMPSPQSDFQSPQHPMPSPQPGYASPQQGFTSPQPGFPSPQQGYVSPQQGYASPHAGYPNSQHMYQAQQQQQQHAYMSPHNPQAGFQSPPHVVQVQGYASPHPGFQSPQSSHQSYHHQQQQQQQLQHQLTYNSQSNNSLSRSQYANQQQPQTDYGNANHSQNYPTNQSYMMQNNSYQTQSQPKPQPMNTSYNNYPNNQSQQAAYLNYKNAQNSSVNVSQQHYAAANNVSNQMHPEYQSSSQAAVNTSQFQQSPQPSFHNQSQMYNHATPPAQKPTHVANTSVQMSQSKQQTHKPPYQSPTSKLRSVRHEVPHVAPKATPPPTSPAVNPGFSNQFLNFITARNEPKDNANTPKFNNSPNISQKMHKNLYVSSPEQGQVPPSTDLNASEISKENSSVQTSASSKNSLYNQSIADKQKDQSKRQLDFEHRAEIQSEDSRDSASKDSRMSSRQSVQSMNTDNYQMDVDSESSMDCQNVTFKSNTSNASVATQDIPRPATLVFPKVIDPFNSELNNSLLQYVKFPNKNHIDGYVEVPTVPKLQPINHTQLGGTEGSYAVEKQLGKGAFGYVYRGLDHTKNKPIALKYQKPGNPWEYYICKEIQARVTDRNMVSK